MNEVDLHCHTTASDGVLRPRQLIERAARLALRLIAITDHDTVAGVPEALESGRALGIDVISGVEINTDVPNGEVHVLGYFVNDRDPLLAAELGRLRAGRVDRARKMAERLAELGAPISFERVLELAHGGAVGRPHVAQALIEAGHVSGFGEAFDRYIGRHGPAYVDRLKFEPTEACRLIRQAGGVPVLAHPVSFDMLGAIKSPIPLDTLLPDLIAAGLLGIEVYYPNYDAHTVEYLLGLARRYNLLVTGGTDFHGPFPDRADLGGIYVPMKAVRRLRLAWEGLGG